MTDRTVSFVLPAHAGHRLDRLGALFAGETEEGIFCLALELLHDACRLSIAYGTNPPEGGVTAEDLIGAVMDAGARANAKRNGDSR